jgi:ATP-dependent DNA ligase
MHNAGRVGSGISVAELERLQSRRQPLVIKKIPLGEPHPT